MADGAKAKRGGRSALTSSVATPATAAAAAPAKGGKAGRRHEEVVEPRGGLAEQEALFRAISSYVRSNTNFESSIPTDAAIEEIGNCLTLGEAFRIPLQRQIFSMDSALRWVLFLGAAPTRAEEEGDQPLTGKAFSPAEALDLITQVYDLGMQEAVWDHFEVDEDDEEEEDEEADN
jgi:hypothetical protein